MVAAIFFRQYFDGRQKGFEAWSIKGVVACSDLIDCQIAMGGSYKLVWYSVVCYIVKLYRKVQYGIESGTYKLILGQNTDK